MDKVLLILGAASVLFLGLADFSFAVNGTGGSTGPGAPGAGTTGTGGSSMGGSSPFSGGNLGSDAPFEGSTAADSTTESTTGNIGGPTTTVPGTAPNVAQPARPPDELGTQQSAPNFRIQPSPLIIDSQPTPSLTPFRPSLEGPADSTLSR